MSEKKLVPIGAACTLSDLKVWVEEMQPDVILIPINHPLRCIKEFNPGKPYSWDSFRGIEIQYEEKST